MPRKKGSLSLRSPPARLSIRSRPNAGNEQQIDVLDGAIGETYADRSAGRSNGQQLGMVNRQRAPIGQVDVERLKRPSLMKLPDLVNHHAIILRVAPCATTRRAV
jgi:hypothetical protein